MALDIDMDVTRFGSTGMLLAKSRQVPYLMVTGTDEANLRDCLSPVIKSFFEAKGEKVQYVSIDSSGGLEVIKVHVELDAAQ
jgi:hypothetical protein